MSRPGPEFSWSRRRPGCPLCGRPNGAVFIPDILCKACREDLDAKRDPNDPEEQIIRRIVAEVEEQRKGGA